jgi:hypothetical protein
MMASAFSVYAERQLGQRLGHTGRQPPGAIAPTAGSALEE